MQPPVTPFKAPRQDREDDYRLRPLAEPKSWMADQPVADVAAHRAATRIYTHNAEHFGRRDASVPVEAREEEAEPTLSPPPQWMMMIAGAAVAALMGALLGGFMHI